MSKNLELLKKYNFEKQLKRLNNSLRCKSILIYGTGLFFKTIKENYDLSNLNIIGISDKRYQPYQEGQEEFGYKIIPYDKIIEYKPDCILIATLNTYAIYQTFNNKKIKDAKIKVLPLVEKPFLELLKEALG